jgi:two-component system chemotaxis sensor kinase CheA
MGPPTGRGNGTASATATTMSIDVSRFHATFLEEAREGLDQIESGVLAIESGQTDEALNAIFRAAHSIKGGAGTFGFVAVSDLTHHLETILDRRRQHAATPGPDLIEVLLDSVDCLRSMFDALESGHEVDADQVAALTERLASMASSAADEADESEPPTDGRHWRVTVRPERQIFLTGNDPARLLEELADVGSAGVTVTADASALPELTELDVETCYLTWVVDLELDRSRPADAVRAAILEVFEWVEDDVELDIVEPDTVEPGIVEPETVEPGIVEPNAAGDAGPSPAPSTQAPSGQTAPTPDRRRPPAGVGTSIRVDIEKVDKLINLVGELVITQSMLQQMTDGDQLVDRDRLREGLAELETHTRDLQGSVLQVRMLPIDVAFSRLPRLVRDLAARLGKKVELVFEGESTELDKTVLEKIGDPLVHLVRNSLDHGIESAEDRVRAGKPEVGTLRLAAHHDGGSIVVSVTDDGAGLNHDRILAKARETGLVTDDEQLSVQQIQRLIFKPGLTTAASVSEVSGRGVGMDVVRRNVTDLGGAIEVDSTPGVGTTFSIRLPLTLAIVDGQLVRVGGDVFVVPLLSIVESLQFDAALASSPTPGAEVYRHREQAIPLIDLRQTLDLRLGRAPVAEPLIVVIDVGGTRAGLLVDELLSQQQIVIKSLTTNFRPVPGLSGATILGDGTVAMILDANSLVGVYRSQELEARL